MSLIVKRKHIKWSIIVAAIIVVSNIPVVSFFIGFISDERHFYGQNDYVYISQSGFDSRNSHYEDYEDIISGFERYKKAYPEDSILYRTFKINPLKFWYWREYIVEPKYRLPYKQL